MAVRVAGAEDAQAISSAFPDPEPLSAAKDDEWDRSPIWEVSPEGEES